jgi:hypothetical protein
MVRGRHRLWIAWDEDMEAQDVIFWGHWAVDRDGQRYRVPSLGDLRQGQRHPPWLWLEVADALTDSLLHGLRRGP